MMKTSTEHWYYQLTKKLASLRPFAWVFARTLHHLDPQVYRLSGHRKTLASLLTGLPVITLTTTGAKSGLKRSVPLIGIPDDDKIVVIASNWGQRQYPAWYYNLRANPIAQVTSGDQRREYSAREALDPECANYWTRAVSIYGGYSAYKRRAKGRRIPVIVLEPVEEGSRD